MGTSVQPPSVQGFSHGWENMLPAPWDSDPMVVLFMVPVNVKFRVRQNAKTGAKINLIKVGNQELALQVTNDPNVKSYIDTERFVTSHGGKMVQPSHIGKLSEINQKFFQTLDFEPLIFWADDMTEPFLHLRGYMRGKSIKE